MTDTTIEAGTGPAIPFQPVGAALARHAAAHPDKIAIHELDTGRALRFGELRCAVERLAALLEASGVARGDRVALLSDERLEKLLVFLAVWRAGAVACPFHPETGGEQLRTILGHVAPGMVLWHAEMDGPALTRGLDCPAIRFDAWPGGAGAEDDLFARLAEMPPDARAAGGSEAGDLACIFSTSGTTDRPKCVVWDHRGLWLCGLSTIEMAGLSAADRLLEYRTFSWLSPQILALMPFLALGLTLYVARRFSHRRFFDWIRDHDVTVAVGVPAVVNMLLVKPHPVGARDLPSLRLMTSSSAPLAPEQWRAFEAAYGIRLTQFYGASEGGWLCGNRHDRRKIGTVGPAAPHMDLAILDADGDPCPPGVEGEIAIRGPQTAVATITPDGVWEDRSPFRLTERLRTGDLGAMDGDGFVTVTGRVKDLIVRGGVNVAPLEIDGVVMTHPKVREAATVGVPDEIYGEEVACYLVAKDGARIGAREIVDHCARQLPPFKLPKHVRVVDALPRSDRGKVRRDELRARWLRETAGNGGGA